MDVHISGHGNRDDITLLLKTIKPDYFIPVYGWHFMLKEAEKLALEIGFKPQNIFVADNGQVIELDRSGGRLTTEKVPSSYVFVDGAGVTDSSNDVVLRDRKMMSEDGMIVVITTIDTKSGNLIGSPDIISRGFVYMKEHKDLIQKVRDKLKNIVRERASAGHDDDYIKNKMRHEIGQYLFQETKRRPMVLPVIIKV
jgi:ribonuclease J